MYLNDIEIPISNYKKIEDELKLQGRTIHWLANNIGICYQHTRKIIKGELPLTEKNYQKMAEVLNMAITSK